MATLFQFGVSYYSDLKKDGKVSINVAKKIQKTVPVAVKNFEPFIRYHSFSNINFKVILMVEKFVDKYLHFWFWWLTKVEEFIYYREENNGYNIYKAKGKKTKVI